MIPETKFQWDPTKDEKFSHRPPLWKSLNLVTSCLYVTKVGDFYNGDLWGNSLSFVGSSWNFVSDYIKNADAYHVSFSSKTQVIKKILPKSVWQTYMKWTVNHMTIFYLKNTCEKTWQLNL